MRYMIAAALVLALAWPALGATWLKRGRTGATIANGGGLQPGEWAQVDVTTNSDDTDVLDMSACENFSVWQGADPDEDGTDSTITGTVEECVDASATDNGCEILPDTAALTGWGKVYGADAVYVRVMAGGTANDDVRWRIHCVSPSAR